MDRPLDNNDGIEFGRDANENHEDEDEGEEEDPYVALVRRVWDLVDTEGNLLSPIDLNLGRMRRIELDEIAWFNHDVLPKKMKMTNTGYTVIVSAKWPVERPYIVDGPFLGKYVFAQLHFHWGGTDMVGSEHTVDGINMPMELHAVHFRADYFGLDEALRERDGVAIVVYFFKLQPNPNENLSFVIDNLAKIEVALSTTRISNPGPIIHLMRPFYRDYYMYWGGLVIGNTVHRVLWIVSREPIGIASEQIAKFRELRDSKNEHLLQNHRGSEDVHGRHVYHANPSGQNHSTLLPIPASPTPLTANQVSRIIQDYD